MATVSNLMRAVAISACVLVFAAGCSKSASTPSQTRDGPPVAHVVNYPLRYFAERIAGDTVDVRFPAPADEDPAFWRPDVETIAAYQSADLILLNGAAYAKWIPMASLPASKMVDTSASFTDRLIEVADDPTHTHGPTGEHAHSGTAFTTWLDFELAIAQADAVHEALVELCPERVDDFKKNTGELRADLERLDAQMTAIAQKIDGAPLVSSHPVYQYWARAYGLDVRSVLWEPDVVPDARAMSELESILVGHPATIMIWEGVPDPESVRRLEAIGVRSVVFDPCGNVPEQGDFLSVMTQNVETLDALFRER